MVTSVSNSTQYNIVLAIYCMYTCMHAYACTNLEGGGGRGGGGEGGGGEGGRGEGGGGKGEGGSCNIL